MNVDVLIEKCYIVNFFFFLLLSFILCFDWHVISSLHYPAVTDSCSTPLEHRGAAVSQTKDALHLLRSLKTTAMVPVQTRIKCLCSPGCCNKTLDTVLFAMRKVYWCTVMRITRNDSIIWTAMELDYNSPTSQVDSVHRHHIGHRSSYNNIVLLFFTVLEWPTVGIYLLATYLIGKLISMSEW